MERSYLIVGAGYVGGGIAQALVPASVTVLRRHPQAMSGILSLQADLTRPETLQEVPVCTDLIYAAAADGSTEESYRAIYLDGLKHVLAALERKSCRPRVIFTSSTSVYAVDDGGWVDEEHPQIASSGLGSIIAAGERYLLEGPWQAKIVRFGGIYGPGRSYFLQRVRDGKEALQSGAPQYTNRIHQADAIGLILHLLHAEASPGIYNGVDGEAADRNEVILWMADQLGMASCQLAQSEGRQKSSHRGHKRVSNRKILNAGYQFKYPSYREGYRPLLAEVLAAKIP